MQKLNTTLVYILSVFGFLCCCIYGVGIIPAAIAFYLGYDGVKKYTANPELYSNGNAMKTAKTVALIVLILCIIGVIFGIYILTNQCEFWSWYLEMAESNPGVTDEQLQPLRDYYETLDCN